MRIIFIIPFILFACNAGKDKKPFIADNPYFDSISRNDIKLEDPILGEWRFYHNEDLQSFDDYKKLNPKKAVIGKTKLYLLPLGNFSGMQQEILQLTREYLEIFFQLKTEVLDPVPDHIIPDSAKRLNRENNLQLYTPYIFEHLLKNKIPADGYALMAVSEKDLYPDRTWNFVFGIASYKDRIGVSSIARYYGSKLDIGNFLLCLKRLTGTAAHEIGHMFSIHHCVFAKCVMNGSNSLPESDKHPLRLCSECQKKLHWNIGYSNAKRLQGLINFLKRNKLQEDLSGHEKDFFSKSN